MFDFKNAKEVPGNLFIAVLEQAGEGCDHTIACGVKVVNMRANTPDEAVEEAKEIAQDYQSVENRLKSLKIIAVASTLNAPLDSWYAKFEQDRKDLEQQLEEINQRQRDEAEFERLRVKLNK